jgi:hypothetical protein
MCCSLGKVDNRWGQREPWRFYFCSPVAAIHRKIAFKVMWKANLFTWHRRWPDSWKREMLSVAAMHVGNDESLSVGNLPVKPNPKTIQGV